MTGWRSSPDNTQTHNAYTVYSEQRVIMHVCLQKCAGENEYPWPEKEKNLPLSLSLLRERERKKEREIERERGRKKEKESERMRARERERKERETLSLALFLFFSFSLSLSPLSHFLPKFSQNSPLSPIRDCRIAQVLLPCWTTFNLI